MAKEEKAKLRKEHEKAEHSKNSQEARLGQLVKQALVAVGAGAVLLVLALGSNFWLKTIQQGQLSATMGLNQYRLGSKALTYAVQSYAVTGEQKYYNNYMKELNEDKNRDKAIAILEQSDITQEEWNGLNEIAQMSQGLVPLEEEAMGYAAAGDTAKAQSYVFSQQYEDTVDKINKKTDEVIGQIQP